MMGPLSGFIIPPNAEFNYTPPSPSIGESVVFEATDKSGTVYKWYFDRSIDINDPDAEGKIVTHEFRESGAHTVTLFTDFYNMFNPLSVIYGHDDHIQTVYVNNNVNEEVSGENIDESTDIVSIQLRGVTTRINKTETAILSFSSVNFSNDNLEINLVLKVPSGMAVSGASLSNSGGGQYSGEFKISPGETASTRVQVNPTRSGRFDIQGIAKVTTPDGETKTYTGYIPIIVE